MDPNQVPVTPVQPPTEPISPQPVSVEQPQVVTTPPVEMAAPLQQQAEPVTPTVVSEPITPDVVVPQSTVSSQVFGSSPQPVENPTALYPVKKSSKKALIIIGAIIVGLGVLAAAAWFVMGYITASSLALKEYSNDQYSLLVPDTYTQEVTGSSATFSKPNTTADTKSSIYVSKIASISDNRSDIIKQIDDKLTPDYLKTSFGSGFTVTNVTIDKSTKGTTDYRTVTADLKKDTIQQASVRFIFVFGEKVAYAVQISAYVSDASLAANAAKITDSFTIK